MSEFFKKLWEKFKAFGKAVKIAIVVAIVSVLVALIFLIVSVTSTKYEVLFSNLDPSDSQTIIAKLDDQKVDKKIEGNSILVPAEQVDQLRMQLTPELSTASKGYELMDDGSSFGMTDDEFNIKKVRMVQGEIEKSIKTIDAVQGAKVLITPATKSVFAKESVDGSASVVVETKYGKSLTKEQVEGIVAIVSMSTENIPKENIAVIDTNGNLLTKNLGSDDVTGADSDTVVTHHDAETKYEEKLVNKVIELLEPVVGKGKVKAQIEVDFDFDSTKISEYEIDPNKALISQETTKEYNNSNSGATSTSPVDDNMSNTIDENDTVNSSGSESQINNYDHSTKKTETIKAPGEIRRLTASVMVNGNLDATTQKAFEDAVKAAIGFDEERKDTISLVGMDFDTTAMDERQEQIDAYNKAVAAEKTRKLIMWGIIAGIILIIIVVAVIIILRRRHKEEERLLDVVVGDEQIGEAVEYEPIDFQTEDEKTHLENEIRKYAQEKPEQVTEIIKSWLSENEG